MWGRRRRPWAPGWAGVSRREGACCVEARALGRQWEAETLRPSGCYGVLLDVLPGRVGLRSRRVGVRSPPGDEGASACSHNGRVKGRHVFARARRIWWARLVSDCSEAKC